MRRGHTRSHTSPDNRNEIVIRMIDRGEIEIAPIRSICCCLRPSPGLSPHPLAPVRSSPNGRRAHRIAAADWAAPLPRGGPAGFPRGGLLAQSTRPGETTRQSGRGNRHDISPQSAGKLSLPGSRLEVPPFFCREAGIGGPKAPAARVGLSAASGRRTQGRTRRAKSPRPRSVEGIRASARRGSGCPEESSRAHVPRPAGAQRCVRGARTSPLPPRAQAAASPAGLARSRGDSSDTSGWAVSDWAAASHKPRRGRRAKGPKGPSRPHGRGEFSSIPRCLSAVAVASVLWAHAWGPVVCAAHVALPIGARASLGTEVDRLGGGPAWLPLVEQMHAQGHGPPGGQMHTPSSPRPLETHLDIFPFHPIPKQAPSPSAHRPLWGSRRGAEEEPRGPGLPHPFPSFRPSLGPWGARSVPAARRARSAGPRIDRRRQTRRGGGGGRPTDAPTTRHAGRRLSSSGGGSGRRRRRA